MPLQFIKSSRGNNLLVNNGFIYRKEREKLDKIVWKCVEYDSAKCAGRCLTINNDIVKLNENHNHVQNAVNIEKRRAIIQIKRNILTQATTSQILAEVTAGLPDSVVGQMPSIAAL